MADRLGSALLSVVSSFWGTKKPAKLKEPERNASQQQLTALPMAFCLHDPRRCIVSICLSPMFDLCALTDNFGRVMLLDASSCTIVRMWKGYRDAQVGWLTANGVLSGKGATAAMGSSGCLFLVILAPRRSLLELWSMRGGGRVFAFNIPDDSHLVYTPNMCFGTAAVGATHRCVLFCCDGRLFEISAPFTGAESISSWSRDRSLLQVCCVRYLFSALY